ncbi:DUF1000-domain-containing protein [Atractiella rhizophila]|nr:DUF1000-domain-containing protein [Atractiella rhizophila]
MPTCEDDLTTADLELVAPTSSSAHVRVAGGSEASTSLYPFVSFSHSYGLNLSPNHDKIEDVVRPLDQKDVVLEAVEEDTEEEEGAQQEGGTSRSSRRGGMLQTQVDGDMIVHVRFSQSVRVKTLLIGTGGGRRDTSPRNCKVWVNRHDGVGFGEAESLKAEQEWELLEGVDGDVGAIEYPTKMSKFANVEELTFFFNNPRSVDTSQLFYLGFKGDPRNAKKPAGEQLKVGAENAMSNFVDRLRESAAGAQSSVR